MSIAPFHTSSLDQSLTGSSPHAREVDNAQTTQDGGSVAVPWSPPEPPPTIGDRVGGGVADGATGSTQTASEWAERLVSFADDARWVVLLSPGGVPVRLGPFHNPAVARERLAAVRLFVAELIGSARIGQPFSARQLATAHSSSAPPPDGGYPLDSDLHQMTDDGGPLSPDPTRWTDPLWRDALVQCDARPLAGSPGVDAEPTVGPGVR